MILGHVKSMMNLSRVRCKTLKVPSPDINDKLISIYIYIYIYIYIFADEQKC